LTISACCWTRPTNTELASVFPVMEETPLLEFGGKDKFEGRGVATEEPADLGVEGIAVAAVADLARAAAAVFAKGIVTAEGETEGEGEPMAEDDGGGAAGAPTRSPPLLTPMERGGTRSRSSLKFSPLKSLTPELFRLCPLLLPAPPRVEGVVIESVRPVLAALVGLPLSFV